MVNGNPRAQRRLRSRPASEYVSRVAKATEGKLDRTDLETIASVPLFQGMSKRQLRSLSARVKVVRYGEGRTVIARGVATGGSMFVLLDGEARVVRGNRTARRLVPGDVFGELTLLDGEPRSASVITDTPVVTARLPRSAFLDLVRTDPSIGVHMMEVLARRLRDCERSQDV